MSLVEIRDEMFGTAIVRVDVVVDNVIEEEEPTVFVEKELVVIVMLIKRRRRRWFKVGIITAMRGILSLYLNQLLLILSSMTIPTDSFQ